METLRIGTETEFVSIELQGGFSEEGWIETRAEIVVDGFRADVRSWFHRYDFENFEVSLRELYRTLKGPVKLEQLSGQLKFELNVNISGHVHLTGEARSGWDNRLTFEIGMDQSYLPETLRQLRSILEASVMS